jgi:hypothetical protein
MVNDIDDHFLSRTTSAQWKTLRNEFRPFMVPLYLEFCGPRICYEQSQKPLSRALKS